MTSTSNRPRHYMKSFHLVLPLDTSPNLLATEASCRSWSRLLCRREPVLAAMTRINGHDNYLQVHWNNGSTHHLSHSGTTLDPNSISRVLARKINSNIPSFIVSTLARWIKRCLPVAFICCSYLAGMLEKDLSHINLGPHQLCLCNINVYNSFSICID